MKKTTLAILLSTILLVSLTGAYAFCANTTPLSPGPAPLSGDGFSDGNQEIRPDSPGIGPAPSSGDGDPDGSGF